MFEYSKFTQQILDHYRTHMELVDTQDINFTGVASERPPAALTSDVSEDIIIFGFTVDFSNAGVLVRIRSITPNYQWMTRGDDQPPQDTPINAIAGIFSQASPILQLVQPFFLKKQSRLEMQFTNSAAGATTGGLITARGLRLTNPYNGFGWDYDIGFKP
jgi:hypothetical protein